MQGPPGSGKSRVVIEAVRRATARGQRVLVSAPSNSAVSPTLAFNLALTLALALALTLALARTLP